MERNTTDPIFLIGSFNSGGNDGLSLGPTAALARFLAANDKFVHLYTPGEFFTVFRVSARNN
jgi:hypothetical protein